MSCTFDLEMSVEMLDAADEPLAFGHVGTGPQGNRIAFLARLYRSMGLVCVAPRRAPVDEGLILIVGLPVKGAGWLMA